MAQKRNTFKEPTSAPKSKPKKRKSKSSSGKTSPMDQLVRVKALVKDERFLRIAGLTFILSAIYMLVAFISFLFTWKKDQDLLTGSWGSMLLSPDAQVENWLGKIGAIVSHQFIHNWFGISSFLFVIVFFLLGFRILSGISLLPLNKVVKHSLFALVWVSVLFGFMFHDQLLFMGGAFGFQVNTWLSLSLGSIGTGFLLVFALAIYAILTFNVSISAFGAWFGRLLFKNPPEEAALAGAGGTGAIVDEDGFTIPEKPAENRPANAASTVVEGLDLELETDEDESGPAAETVQVDSAATELETEPTAAVETEATTEEDDGFTVEIAQDDSHGGAAGEALTIDPATVAAATAGVESMDGDEAIDLEATAPEAPTSEAAEGDDGDLQLAIEETEDDQLSEEDAEAKLADVGDYDPTLDLARFELPPLELLEDHGSGQINVDREELEANKNNIVQTLANYKIGIAKIKATIGPTVTLYEIVPEAGVRISKIKNLEDDIALSLAALGIRIIAPIPGKGTIGIEVPNSKPEVVSMKTVVASEKFATADMALPLVLGKTISNETFVTDLAKAPHILMAGATGQGKSVGLNAILVSLLYKKHPSQIKFVLVDPKKVELTLFNKIERHYLAKLPDSEEAIITDTTKVVNTVNSLCIEMDERYELLKEAQCRNIKEYNAKFVKRRLNPEKGHRFLPYIVLVIDEFADLIMTAGKEIETPIARLAQLARAIGIHLIVATQRPSVNIITGTIKANFPSRVAFRVTSKVDSRTILDAGGAEQLIGRGDMLFSNGNDLIRLQCAFVDTPEVEEITDFIGNQQGYSEAFILPEYVGEGGGDVASLADEDRDALFEDAARVVVMHQQGSASLLQRKLKLGYNRAGRIVDQLEAAGIIGPFEGSKARQVLIPDEISLERYLTGGDEPSNEGTE